MNELIMKMENKTSKQLASDFRKSLETFKKSSGRTALTLFMLLQRAENKEERAEMVKNIMDETRLSKSTISQLVKAGGFIYNNPDCLTLGSTACYKLAKEAEKEVVEAEVTEAEAEVTEAEAEAEVTEAEAEAEVTEAEAEVADIDLYSITFEASVWRNIYKATSKSTSEDVKELRKFIKNTLGL